MNEYISAKQVREQLGISSSTIKRWRQSGRIKFIQPGKRNYYYDVRNILCDEEDERKDYIYCRVSTRGQQGDLGRQIEFLKQQYPTYTVISDIGSGLNCKRHGYKTLLEQVHQGKVRTIVVAHKDRLCRFGFETIKWLVEKNKGQIVVLNDEKSSPEQELVKDLISIITVFSARIYGLRSYKNKIKKDQTVSNTKPKTDP